MGDQDVADNVSFRIGKSDVAPGTRLTVNLPVCVMSDHTPVTLSVHVVNGRQPGPVLFVSAAVHGDEVIGVEIVRRLLKTSSLDAISGTLLVIPVVNSFGFITHSRYLPDRRDLNRTFPGNAVGSLAARLADLFMAEIIARSDFGIDLHSAAIHRTNLPQVRVSPGRPGVMARAEAFGAPLILVSPLRPGSLRQSAAEVGVDMLLYEAGEGLRFDENAVRTGVAGILRVMHDMQMITDVDVTLPTTAPIQSSASVWERAPAGGLLRAYKTTGEEVELGNVLGVISDPFGDIETEIVARRAGVIIGRTNLPVVNEGDGLFHIAKIKKADDPERTIDELSTQLDDDPLFDEDEII